MSRRCRCTPARAGVIDEHLAALGLRRNVVVRSAHFSLIPLMVAQSLLVLTTGRLFCSRYVDALPVRIVRCPVPFPAADLLPALARPDPRRRRRSAGCASRCARWRATLAEPRS